LKNFGLHLYLLNIETVTQHFLFFVFLPVFLCLPFVLFFGNKISDLHCFYFPFFPAYNTFSVNINLNYLYVN
jgi:hypothetical protein